MDDNDDTISNVSDDNDDSIIVNVSVDNDDSIINVFVDGACFQNGAKRPIGGVGVFVANDNSHNVSRSIRTGRITNQIMELEAARAGLDVIHRLWAPHRTAVLYTDSIYVMNCLTKWVFRWETNGWITKNKRTVQNVDIIKRMFGHVKDCNHTITFKRIRIDPTTDPNDYTRYQLLLLEAEQLARQAAMAGSRSGCYIRRDIDINTDSIMS